ncbi:MAG: peptide ABC transporter substrate-binding protein [Dehalococcoidia bacterium]|nr:MAG: peptide ABC transporter substrate-binding protein [Dehalococcoidia bacterium]
MRIGLAGDPPMGDPLSISPPNQVLCGLIYSRLLRPRAGAGVPYDSGDVIEDLAEKWEQVDEVVYVFYLRRGVRWQDLPPVAGRELIADDVRLSLERLIAQRTNAPSLALSAIDRIDLPDRYTVKLTLREPLPSIVSALASPLARIVPAELVEREADLRRLPVGSGPFLLPSLSRTGRLVLRKNPGYFRTSQPYLESVELISVPDRAAELALLKSRESDLGIEPTGLSASEADSVRAANPDLSISRIQRPSVILLGFNDARAPFNDVRLRQAISLAVDRRRLGGEVYGEHYVLSGHVPASLADWALAPEEVERLWGRRDLARARALWSDAAAVDPGELIMLVHPSADVGGLADLIVEQIRDIGVRVRPLRPEPAILSRLMSERAFDLLLVQPAPSTEVDDWTGALYSAASPRNPWGYADRRFDELLVRTRRGPDRELRRRAAIELQRYLADKLPAAPLFSPVHFYAVASNVKGWAPHWSAGLPSLDEAWIYRSPEATPTGRG